MGTTLVTGGVRLTWSGVAGATGYRVWRRTSTGSPYTALTASPVTATSYTDVQAGGSGTYLYVVTAVNGNGEGPYSAEMAQSR